MADKNQSNIEIRRVVEYSNLFVGEKPIDVDAVLKQYDRKILMHMAIILSCHYGNLFIPDSSRTLFSEESKKHINTLKKLFKRFYEESNIPEGSTIVISTFRTALELWRHIFAIRPEEYKGTIKNEDAEYNLFKVLITLNEKIVAYVHKDKDYKLDELLFLNQFLTNDTNNFDFKRALQPQLYYVYHLAQLSENNDVIRKASEVLFDRWGISSWKQYVGTLMYLANLTEEYRKSQKGGVPKINLQKLSAGDQTGLFSASLVQALSVEEDEYIPYDDPDAQTSVQNVDYRVFRSKPFIHFKSGEYAVVNIQLLCERVFNSLYFDFLPIINGRNGSVGFFDYNKDFVEKILFRQTFFKCLPFKQFTFPLRDNSPEKEESNEPDFYSRRNSDLIICECKAIKMNGSIRDDGDYHRLLDELHEKIVLKTKNLDTKRKEHKGEPEPIGIGQLIHHIESIDNDTFEWDDNIPDEVTYYPIMVFEDIRILQPGLLSIINRWFNEELAKKESLKHLIRGCQPVMAISINTLFLYDNLIRGRGFTLIIDEFVHTHSYTHVDGCITLYEDADFDDYLRHNPFRKRNELGRWLISRTN